RASGRYCRWCFDSVQEAVRQQNLIGLQSLPMRAAMFDGKLYAILASGTSTGRDIGVTARSAHFKLRMWAAIMDDCSCSATLAAASSASLMARSASDAPFGL